MYRRQNSSVLIGFIDASKLSQRGVPNSITRILAYWYANHAGQVGKAVSTPFGVGNGVRQGGLLSPALFNIYMNDLSEQLRASKTGCMVGNILVNHLMYADDLAIFSPSSTGFQEMLNICTEYGVKFDVKYNSKKSVVLICKTKGDKDLTFPSFYLSGQALTVGNKTKYTSSQIKCVMMTSIGSDTCYMHKLTCW